MNIFVIEKGNRQGPFTTQQAVECIRQGRFQMTDMAWREGMNDWMPIHTLIDLVQAVLPPIPIDSIANNLPARQNPKEHKGVKLMPSPKCLKEAISDLPKTANLSEQTSKAMNKRIIPVIMILVMTPLALLCLFGFFRTDSDHPGIKLMRAIACSISVCVIINNLNALRNTNNPPR